MFMGVVCVCVCVCRLIFKQTSAAGVNRQQSWRLARCNKCVHVCVRASVSKLMDTHLYHLSDHYNNYCTRGRTLTWASAGTTHDDDNGNGSNNNNNMNRDDTQGVRKSG